MVYQLDNKIWFPNPRLADDDGCLAVGGDLSVERLLLAYQHGIFPWFSFRDYDEPLWFCPHERFVIFPSEIHVSHSMRTLLNKGKYCFNNDFDQVISTCSRLRIGERGAWLGDEMVNAYKALHRQGYATSIEVWEEPDDPAEQPDHLVGGLYGVTIGRAFFGESMFSLVPNGSKLALIFLARVMEKTGGTLIDCQFKTAHLESMGGRFISYDDYMSLVRQ